MINDELKILWQEINQDEKGNQYSEEVLKEMLKNKTLNIFQKLNKNINISFVILGGYLFYSIISNFLAVAILERKGNPILSNSLKSLDKAYLVDLSLILILTGILLYFSNKFRRININAPSQKSIKENVETAINLLNETKKFFSWWVIIFIAVNLSALVLGACIGVLQMQPDKTDAGFSAIFIIVVVVAIVGSLLIYLLHKTCNWIFNKLYGDYLKQLLEFRDELVELF